MRSRKMWELTWPEIGEVISRGGGIILPIGAIEQHGHHLPIMTDTFIPTALAEEIADDTDMLVAPPIAYGLSSRPLSGGGQTFIGTTSLSGETFMRQVEDILREFMRHGFKKIVLFNWHSENMNFVYEAAFQATNRGTNKDVKIMIMEAPFGTLSDETMRFLYGDEFPGWPLEHAAVLETSIMLYLKPELVLNDKIIDDGPPDVPWYDILPIPDRIVAKSGCLWKATLASEEKGRYIWDELKKSLAETVNNEFKKDLS